MTRKTKPALIRLPGFVPSAAAVNHSLPPSLPPSLPVAFVRESSEILTHHNQDLLLEENPELIVMKDDQLLFDVSLHFDHDIPERVCLRALLARAVC